MVDFPKKYKFEDSERQWQEIWQQKKIYKWDESCPREENYVIDTPPPTVSGNLHIGHVFSYVHTDFVARYQRMRGKNVFYPMGFDDNGLPTERLVEKKKKVKASQMSRQEFVDVCQEVIVQEEEKFKELFDGIGLSVDWDQKYRTIDPIAIRLSQLSFLDLFSKKQIYRDSQPMLWDPVDQTALAQADIEEKERSTFMNDLIFKTDDGSEVMISTTRPELLPACLALFYHPDDPKYQHLAGKFAISPLFGVKIPILPDDLVDPEKGTGLVMCCSFGDQTDISWWRRHKLPTKIIFTKNGKIRDDVEFDDNCTDIERAKGFMSEIANLKIKEAREKIIEILKSNNILTAQHEKMQMVKCAERSGAPLEILTTPQWFIKSVDHKEELAKKSDQLNWYPQSMKIKLDSWIAGVSLDWCISRQRYFGVPFPVWYSKRAGEEGRVILPEPEDLPIDPMKDLPKGYSKDEVEPDMDVMDTWSTSSVSPQLNSHGIAPSHNADERRHAKLFPADLRPQAHEILRTWAYYTMLKAHLHEGKLPWHNIMVSGWCLAEDKTKMSKSKGNIISPVQLLKDYGADVIRYWSSSARLGSDTAYSEDVMKNGKRLVNKLYNAAKFVAQYFDKLDDKTKAQNLEQNWDMLCCDVDKYFAIQLSRVKEQVQKAFDQYDYATAMDSLESFFWKVFCDNYLEIVKTRAYNEDGQNDQAALSARVALHGGFKVILQLFAPFIPYVTEELYHLLYSKGEHIHQRNGWPEMAIKQDDKQLAADYENFVAVLDLVRKAKAQDNLSIKTPLALIEIVGARFSENMVADLRNVTSAAEIKFVQKLSDESSGLEAGDIKILCCF